MLSSFTIKAKFENNNQIHELKLSDTDKSSFFVQQEKILSLIVGEKEMKVYSLYNQQNNKFFINLTEIKNIQPKDTVYILKNCNDFSKKIVEDMYKYLNIYKSNLETIQKNSTSIQTNQTPNTKANELKNIVFSLQNYFLIDAFTEEFIAFEGIQKLIEILEISSGNTQVNSFF